MRANMQRANMQRANTQRATRSQAVAKATRAKSKRTGSSSSSSSRSRSRARRMQLRAQQTELTFPAWGGARKGAGRKPKGERAMLPHRSRPDHKTRFPVLVTTRLRAGLPSLRRPGEAARIRAALASVNEIVVQGTQWNATEAALFQVVHHSIQSNHLHLIVEAADRRALSRGVQGLLVRIARGLNRLWQRCGSVFADRFHERELRKPRQVRNALVYVLQNLRKHGIHIAGPDPYSSGPEFRGWSAEFTQVPERGATFRGSRMGGDPLPEFLRVRRTMGASVPDAKTWLLQVGWLRHGSIDPRESPLRN